MHVHVLLYDERRHETVQGGFRAFGRPSVRRSLGAKAHERAASERGDAQIYSGAAEYSTSAALHKSAIRGIQELRKLEQADRRTSALRRVYVYVTTTTTTTTDSAIYHCQLLSTTTAIVYYYYYHHYRYHYYYQSCYASS